MHEIFETIVNAIKPDTSLFDLSAIHLSKPIMTDRLPTRKLEAGMKVFINDENKLSDCICQPSHIITSLRGRLNDTDFEITVANIKTYELSIVKL